MCEEKKKAPKVPGEDIGKKVLRQLQGEDGYAIFSDRNSEAEQQRYLREYEEDRG